MAIYLKGNQHFFGFRLDGIFFFDPELLKLWVHADYPNQRHFFIDLDDGLGADTSQHGTADKDKLERGERF